MLQEKFSTKEVLYDNNIISDSMHNTTDTRYGPSPILYSKPEDSHKYTSSLELLLMKQQLSK